MLFSDMCFGSYSPAIQAAIVFVCLCVCLVYSIESENGRMPRNGGALPAMQYYWVNRYLSI
jgi:hypothetical protein